MTTLQDQLRAALARVTLTFIDGTPDPRDVARGGDFTQCQTHIIITPKSDEDAGDVRAVWEVARLLKAIQESATP